jgi:hypothetical protein
VIANFLQHDIKTLPTLLISSASIIVKNLSPGHFSHASVMASRIMSLDLCSDSFRKTAQLTPTCPSSRYFSFRQTNRAEQNQPIKTIDSPGPTNCRCFGRLFFFDE